MLLRTFTNRDLGFMKFSWKTYVQPIWDYASQVWSPIEGGLLYKFESLFKSYTSKISNLSHLDYWSQLKKLKMYSITRRCERYSIIYCFKVINRRTHNCNFLCTSTQKYDQVFNLKDKSKYELANRRQSFYFMGLRLFNTLPVYMRPYLDDMNFDNWKSALDKFLESIPENPVTGPNHTGVCEYLTTKQTNLLFY